MINIEKEYKRNRNIILTAWVVNGILGVGALGLVVWVIVHFLRKVW